MISLMNNFNNDVRNLPSSEPIPMNKTILQDNVLPSYPSALMSNYGKYSKYTPEAPVFTPNGVLTTTQHKTIQKDYGSEFARLKDPINTNTMYQQTETKRNRYPIPIYEQDINKSYIQNCVGDAVEINPDETRFTTKSDKGFLNTPDAVEIEYKINPMEQFHTRNKQRFSYIKDEYNNMLPKYLQNQKENNKQTREINVNKVDINREHFNQLTENNNMLNNMSSIEPYTSNLRKRDFLSKFDDINQEYLEETDYSKYAEKFGNEMNDNNEIGYVNNMMEYVSNNNIKEYFGDNTDADKIKAEQSNNVRKYNNDKNNNRNIVNGNMSNDDLRNTAFRLELDKCDYYNNTGDVIKTNDDINELTLNDNQITQQPKTIRTIYRPDVHNKEREGYINTSQYINSNQDVNNRYISDNINQRIENRNNDIIEKYIMNYNNKRSNTINNIDIISGVDNNVNSLNSVNSNNNYIECFSSNKNINGYKANSVIDNYNKNKINISNNFNNTSNNFSNVVNQVVNNSVNSVNQVVNSVNQVVNNSVSGVNNNIETFNGATNYTTSIANYMTSLMSQATALIYFVKHNPDFAPWMEYWCYLDENIHKQGPDLIFEQLSCSDADVAYVENKGEKMRFRIRDNMRFVPLSVYTYILIHEMAHLANGKEWGHGPKFQMLMHLLEVAGYITRVLNVKALPTSTYISGTAPILSKDSIKEELYDGIKYIIKNNGHQKFYSDLWNKIKNE